MEDDDSSWTRRPRIIAGLALVALVIVIELVRPIDAVSLGILLGAALLLLGIEAGRALIR